ncbi:YheC/YheD family protein [Oscillatoria sp. FACHB-1406]|uniref:ATP-grasp domain-containing protein n=1 Tax=Oscillatoria sp. FACHB-1406 TaxID=2692846 RepID=UPI0016856051|nr:YheC/YheD family protein [Oscillatoria sp. FACHB-1406]MBD2578581.1 alpha-L-glutamate ligase [Oscillatoria sp. FACHB-1406]
MLGNIQLLIAACQELNIDFQIIHSTQNIVKVNLGKSYFFVNYTTPFLDQSLAKILRDKDYTFQVLKASIKMPYTMSFLSPFCDPKYQRYLKLDTIDSITDRIIDNFTLPIIVKRNSGSSGSNVFLCEDRTSIKKALENIFDLNTKEYDYIALAQEYVKIELEYRAIFCNRQLKLLYRKNNSNACFTGNLSPLHWEGAIAEHITDARILQEIQDFVQPVFQELDLAYGGFDIARDDRGNYWLIEINSHPNFDIFTRDNDPSLAIEIFKTMLQSLSA